MNKKRVTALAFAVVVAVSAQAASVSAASLESSNTGGLEVNQIIRPQWTSTSTVVPSISASGKEISVSILIIPYSQSESSKGTLYLQKYDGSKWVSEKSWSISEKGTVSITKTYTGKSNTKYRTKVVVTTGVDDITATSSEITL